MPSPSIKFTISSEVLALGITGVAIEVSDLTNQAARQDFDSVMEESVQRMKYLPALVLFVGVLGLGTGVWLVRRR